MNKKFFSVLFIAVLTASYVQAQFTFGARAGLNLTNVSVKYEGKEYEASKPKYKPSFQIGVVGEYGISDNFAIQPGILFATQGYKLGPREFIMDDMLGWEVMATVNINYLQIPINAQYKINLGSSAFLLQAGPYFGFAFGGKTKTEFSLNNIPSSKEKTDLVFGNKEDQLSPFDFGLGLGIGLQLNAIQIGLKYHLGLADLYHNERMTAYLFHIEKLKMNNRGFSITVTYFFSK